MTSLFPFPLKAEDLEPSLSGTISLDLLIPLALERNGKILAGTMKWGSVIEKFPQTTFLDDPEIGIDTQKLKLIQAKVEKSNLAIELAEKKYYPDLSLGFAYFENRKGNKVGVAKTEGAFNQRPNIKTDLWFGKDDAYIREARSRYRSLLKQARIQ